MNKQPLQPYDIVGDIHGELGALERLLSKLGYREAGGSLAHPEGRKLLFLGDFIDRGPDSRGVLRLVRRLVDSGAALAIMGNHEFNFAAYHTVDRSGKPLRENNDKHKGQIAATTRSFEGYEREIPEWVEWMRGLPLFLDLGAFRAVHAAWVPGDIEFLKRRTLSDYDFFIEASRKGTATWQAIERVLKGIEMKMPDGLSFLDANRIERHHMRVRWWGPIKGQSWHGMAFPAQKDLPEGPAEVEGLADILAYGEDEPPVFFGHYKLIGYAPELRTPNVACLDFGLGHGAPATAYRWNGERALDAGNLVQVK